jgi:DNA mismatch repair protein MutL
VDEAQEVAVSRIERLGDDLVNKIAAGEVVERPASVVKELLENALDAEATAVSIEIEGGGKTLVRVSDDGTGMDRDDAEKALQRHATSKLRELADLQNVVTHGFRGEALPSIASVSRLVLRTSEGQAPAGTEIEVRHGRLAHVKDAGHPRGTTVEVRDLFGAVPARRKFLRADGTESAHVAEAVTVLALARPEVGFTLRSTGRPIIQAPAVEALPQRVFQLFGDVLDDLVVVDGGEGWARVRGFVARPDRPGAARATVRLYVNGRPVRDRGIARALADAYRQETGRELRGEAILFLEAPTHMIDVNVHPAKTEVRFAEPRMMWRAVQGGVRDALSSGTRTIRRADRAQDEAPSETAVADHEHGAGIVADRGPRWSPAPAIAAAPLFVAAGPTVLGQHRNTYIVATDGEDLVLVDQHTAHERVRYEALKNAHQTHRVESQMLLIPVVFTLAPRLRPVLEGSQEALRAVGYDVEPFGGEAVRVSAVPAVLAGRDPAVSLEHVLRDVLERENAGGEMAEARHRVFATIACHSAARGGQPLAREAMAAIVAGLWQAEQPAVCPHGRPTRVRVPRDDVSRWFGRTGWRRQ